MIYKRKLLEPHEVDKIQELLSFGGWEDGLVSVEGGTHDLKTNLESTLSADNRKELNSIIYSGLDRDGLFLGKTAAKSTGSPIISKTSVGGYYRPHQDRASNGDYSTTLFLDDPSDYEGGSLRLYDGCEIVDVKLERGWAVTYDTGTPHEVSEVTSGSRTVAVFWTHSRLKLGREMQIFENMYKLQNILPSDINNSLEDAISDPRFIIDCLIKDISRTIIPLEEE